MFKYTICLIRKEDQFLLLNRRKQPAMGMWNGVGGKIEANETPVQGIKRETFEETGIKLKEVTYAGNVILKSQTDYDGIYIFIADFPEYLNLQTPVNTREGILDWKSIDWILNENNMGVISNLKCYLPKILAGELDLEHTMIYDSHQILEYSTAKITQNDVNTKYGKTS